MRRAFSFTSGSTGPAKGVRYTHRIFDAQTRAIKEMYGIEAGEIDLPCFPLFGLFYLGTRNDRGHSRHGPHKACRGRPEVAVGIDS